MIASSPSARLRSDLSVRKIGLSGRGLRSALEAGRSTEMSTVASGAAIMKMISSTRITSMNGVTLISCSFAEIVVAVVETDAHRRLLRRGTAAAPLGDRTRRGRGRG